MDRLSSERRSWLMGRVKSRNTTTEMAVRRLIHGMGYRYRLHDKQLPGKPDIVLKARKKIVFVNGCFWHGHEGCRYGRLPKSKVSFWLEKITKNKARDEKSRSRLEQLGWRVLTVWQCELKNPTALTESLYEFLEK